MGVTLSRQNFQPLTAVISTPPASGGVGEISSIELSEYPVNLEVAAKQMPLGTHIGAVIQ